MRRKPDKKGMRKGKWRNKETERPRHFSQRADVRPQRSIFSFTISQFLSYVKIPHRLGVGLDEFFAREHFVTH